MRAVPGFSVEPPTRILIIDDEEAARYGISRALANQGYELAEAENGIAALARIEEFQPDVIVSDINMPGMDGIALLRHVNQGPEPPMVVLITAYGSEQVAIEALRSGAHNYISKPFDIEELRLIVAGAVEKRRLLRELKESQTARIHAEKMASLGRLVAGIAHEINNPLGALLSDVDTIRRAAERVGEWSRSQPAETTANVRAAVEALAAVAAQSQTACERIDAVVRNMKQFAQLDRAELLRASVETGLESTIHLLRYEFGDRVRVETQFGRTPEIECAPRELNQLFMNLLLNAKEAIEQTGRPGVIRVRSWTDRDAVKVEISDDGCGIAPEHLGQIFDPGFTTKGVRVGTGLGLPICHQIARAHHGRIDVSSRPGEGATFTVTLPLRIAEGEYGVAL